jgi:hypothetical protein
MVPEARAVVQKLARFLPMQVDRLLPARPSLLGGRVLQLQKMLDDALDG